MYTVADSTHHVLTFICLQTIAFPTVRVAQMRNSVSCHWINTGLTKECYLEIVQWA
jgi:hypothetical protein